MKGKNENNGGEIDKKKTTRKQVKRVQGKEMKK